MRHIPVIVVAGTHSGCGKTTLASGLMAALAARGLAVQPSRWARISSTHAPFGYLRPDVPQPRPVHDGGEAGGCGRRSSVPLPGGPISPSSRVRWGGSSTGSKEPIPRARRMSQRFSTPRFFSWLTRGGRVAERPCHDPGGLRGGFDSAVRVAGAIFNRIGSPPATLP
ncbi:hypothetical protein [Methanoculleus chikugoensis]|uniref:nucleotide-binding protein n=1 Tax=Methanoculleus chikugoensis TaxID=118126 RepID=UPI001FB416F7|nr:hypothetical protein [Methanoculleus chikugoensis]